MAAASLTDDALADLLPGTWRIAATNFPMWLSGGRRDPRFTYGLVSRSPLVLSDDVGYTEDGSEKHILGRDTWHSGGFVWRGRGWLRLVSSHWAVAGVSEDRSIAAIRFAKSLATPAGIDLIVREGTAYPELRATIARSTATYGLTPEDFASLSWLRPQS